MDHSAWSTRRARERVDESLDGESLAETPDELLVAVGRGSKAAFERLYDLVSAPVFGMVRQVVRDPAQSEEVTQEVMVELWRTAARYDPARGSALNWALTLAHRRAVDRVRSARARTEREQRAGARTVGRDYDEVSEAVATRLERAQIRRCLNSLTGLQRESILLAYYGGHSYPEVAALLGAPLSTVKARLRDGLIRLRDCLEVTA